jgi:Zn-dependent protease
MREQVRLGQVFGIEIGMNWSVLVIGALLVFGLAGGASGVAVWATAIVAVGLFFGSLLAHEISHSVIAQHNGVRVQGITLWLLGGVSRLEGTIPSAGAEFRIALAGPAMSLVLAALFFGFSGLASAVGISALIVSGLLWLALVNGLLAAFNLVPAAPLDGGRVLASVLWAVHHDRTRAEVGATRVGQVVGVGMIIAGIVGALAGSTLDGLWSGSRCWAGSSTAVRRPNNAPPALSACSETRTSETRWFRCRLCRPDG